MTNVILVDENDIIIWQKEKLATHIDGDLHRAFSVYVFDDQGRVLLQQRAMSKYHSPWLYANTCCSHQLIFDDGTIEENMLAAHRRLGEEMWFDCELTKITEFVYHLPVPPELTEYEYLHVYKGKYTWQEINPNPDEVMNYWWISSTELTKLCQQDDSRLAPWTKYTWLKCGEEMIG